MKKFLFSPVLSGFAVMPAAAGGVGKVSPRVLIIYYSQSGNTEYIAQMLQKKTDGDLFRLETVRTYPSERPGMTEEPKKELETGNLPALKKLPADLSSYDLILVGSPVWWYTVSTPVMSFLKQTDFKGKKVAAFSTHGGGLGNFFHHFKEQAKNAVVPDGFDIYKPMQKNSIGVEESLDTWLGTLAK